VESAGIKNPITEDVGKVLGLKMGMLKMRKRKLGHVEDWPMSFLTVAGTRGTS
jgi:hypothetical protein